MSRSRKMFSWVFRLFVGVWCFVVVCARKEDENHPENFELDLNDILNAELMPSALFFRQDIVVKSNHSYPEMPLKGDFGKAYKLMGFHRKMMNEYLCNHFIAKQILSEVAPDINSTLSHRIGTSMPQDGNNTYENATKISRQPKMIPNGELLYDDGSNGYKKWLSKTTTLEDVYRQFSNNPQNGAIVANKTTQARILHGSRRTNQDVHETPEHDYPDGDMTTYAIQQAPIQQMPVEVYRQAYAPGPTSTAEYPLPMPYPTAGSKNGYFPSGQDGVDEGYNYGTVAHGNSNKDEKPSKELGIKEVMEIAMTTLAFLSFGMFILQVLMCITMDNSKNMMMMPMEAAGGGDVEELRRKKRSNFEYEQLQRINEIARRVILSMDAVVHTEHDDGQCLFRILCENNKFARKQEDNQKMWIPVWGLGLSWLSSRMARSNVHINMRLASLKASVFGLGNANCSKVYSKCDYEKMAEFRRRQQEAVDVTNAKERWTL